MLIKIKFVVITIVLLGFGCRSTIPAAKMESIPKAATYTPAGDYRLGPGDEIRIKVVGDATLDGSYFVSDKGQLLLPVLGAVNVQSLTEPELRAQLEKRIANYVKNPSTSVQIVSKRSYRAYFSGEFTRVGQIQFEERPSLLAAIALAGGLTPFASGRIVVVRSVAPSSTASTEPRRFAAHYDDIKAGEKGLDLVYLERGDVVIAE